MITAAVFDIICLLVGELIELFPPVEVPGWLGSATGYIPTVFAFASSMGVWFPWDVLSVVLMAVFGVWIASFGFKVIRICISHVTGGGGSAA